MTVGVNEFGLVEVSKLCWEVGEFHFHVLRAFHWGVKVKIFQVNCAVLCSGGGNHTVEVNFNGDHVNGGCATIPRVRDAISPNGELGAIGVRLFWSIVDADAAIGNVFLPVAGDIVSPDEHNSVGARALA